MILNIQRQEKNTFKAYSPSSDFGTYLQISEDQLFVFDLSQATLIEIIDEQIKVKQKLSPKYGKGMSCLKKHLRLIEEQFGCTLMPVQITDIFWIHFTHHLQCNGISIPFSVAFLSTKPCELADIHRIAVFRSIGAITISKIRKREHFCSLKLSYLEGSYFPIPIRTNETEHSVSQQ